MWRPGFRIGGTRPAIALAALFIAAGAAASRADAPVYAEGEDYLNYEWHNIGGTDIRVESCSGASQGLAAGGLDVPGEWIMLKAVFPKERLLRCARLLSGGVRRHGRVRRQGSRPLGAGRCGARFLQRAGVGVRLRAVL